MPKNYRLPQCGRLSEALHCTSGKWDRHLDAKCYAHNIESNKLGLEQEQPVPRLQQEDSLTTAIHGSAPRLYMKRTASHAEMFRICLRRLLNDIITHDSPTSMQAQQLFIPRQTHMHLCSKLPGHASDQMRELSSITILYNLHEEIRTAAKV